MKQGVPIKIPYHKIKGIWFKYCIDQFFKKTEYLENGCLEWQGTVYPNGTTCFRIYDIGISAKRISYMLFIGEIPEGYTVRNTCRNNLCVNHEHLYLDIMGRKYKDKKNAIIEVS